MKKPILIKQDKILKVLFYWKWYGCLSLFEQRNFLY